MTPSTPGWRVDRYVGPWLREAVGDDDDCAGVMMVTDDDVMMMKTMKILFLVLLPCESVPALR